MLIPASEADIPDVVALMNLAFRGVGADAGWNSEADYIDGERITEPLLRRPRSQAGRRPAALARGGRRGDPGLRAAGADRRRLVLGIPDCRSSPAGPRSGPPAAGRRRGLGGRTRRRPDPYDGCQRTLETLIAWYLRRGYAPTGETLQFPYDETRYGFPRRDDLEFVVLSKTVGG